MIISAYQLVESKNTFVPSDEVDLFKSIFGNEYQLPSTFREQASLAEKLKRIYLLTCLEAYSSQMKKAKYMIG